MRRKRLWVLGALLALAIPCAAHAGDDDDSVGPLGLLNYTVSGGGIIPVASAGGGIESGPTGNAAIHYDPGSGFLIGAEGGYTRSRDDLGTGFASFGLTARISPPDYNAAYIRIGVGGYAVSYDPKSAAAVAPGGTVRPGGSFGVGFEMARIPRFALGVSGTYHRIAMTVHDARAYVALTLDLTFRPYEF
jgi:hypothetical protein